MMKTKCILYVKQTHVLKVLLFNYKNSKNKIIESVIITKSKMSDLLKINLNVGSHFYNAGFYFNECTTEYEK